MQRIGILMSEFDTRVNRIQVAYKEKFKTLTTLGDRSFAGSAPKLWNSLPYTIRSSSSVASFKKALKTFLFQTAF